MRHSLLQPRVRFAALLTSIVLLAGVIVSGYWNVDRAEAAEAGAYTDWVGQFDQAQDVDELGHYAEWTLTQIGVPAADWASRMPPRECGLMGELGMVWLFLTPAEAAKANALVGQGGLDAAESTGVVSLPEPVAGGGPWVAPGRRGTEITPVGLERIGVPVDTWRSAPSSNGVRVAVIDTGIDGRHDDLNVVGGINCSLDERGVDGYDIDLHGHGTHVGGTIGAAFNDLDVVGIAPGVALFSEVTFSASGSASGAMVLAALNHALVDGADVISASLGGMSVPSRCGGPSVYTNGWCKAAQRAVVVVAAGNDTEDAILHAPANVEGVVTVGAIIDYDGEPGGLGRGSTGCGYQHLDDYVAVFSNFGSVVDVVAPGGCIESTLPFQQTGWMSGTSMATPHVTGVFAAFMAHFPDCRGQAAIRTVLGYADDFPVDYDGWPGAEPPPLIHYVNEDPLRIQPLPPAEPTPCKFEEQS